MRTFSEQVQGKETAIQRRLYTLFQRAVKAGEFPALKLLTRFDLVGTKGQARKVQDYAYTGETAEQVLKWVKQHEQARTPRGVKVEDLQGMTDAQLTALIQQQARPTKKRNTRKQKKAEKPAQNDTQANPSEGIE